MKGYRSPRGCEILAAIEGIAEEWVVKEVERLKEQNDSFCVELVTEGVLLKERIEALERVAEAARVCLKRRGGESACWN